MTKQERLERAIGKELSKPVKLVIGKDGLPNEAWSKQQEKLRLLKDAATKAAINSER